MCVTTRGGFGSRILRLFHSLSWPRTESEPYVALGPPDPVLYLQEPGVSFFLLVDLTHAKATACVRGAGTTPDAHGRRPAADIHARRAPVARPNRRTNGIERARLVLVLACSTTHPDAQRRNATRWIVCRSDQTAGKPEASRRRQGRGRLRCAGQPACLPGIQWQEPEPAAGGPVQVQKGGCLQKITMYLLTKQGLWW